MVDAGHHDRAAIVVDWALDRWRADGAPEIFGIVDAPRARAILDRHAGRYARRPNTSTVPTSFSRARRRTSSVSC
ncbi:MAG TPA: hypothetical protein VKD67_01010 [Acidimicrobiales bacterium]|nr:hypothetical protein [Acidimicrobiales bacterium]